MQVSQKTFTDLFRGYPHAHGYAFESTLVWREDKNKWSGGLTTRGEITEQMWEDFFAGKRHLGMNPNLGDGTVWFACIDVDIYEIDYADEMRKIAGSGLPLVVCRTRSGGLRIFVFFKEPISAELADRVLRRWSALLGYAGSEIFPKQTGVMAEKDDCGNWIYLPYGPTFGKLAEQCAMTDSGNPMTLAEFVMSVISKRVTREQFVAYIAEEERIKTTSRINNKKRNSSGRFVEEATEEETIRAMFCDGPVCMWDIAHERCKHNQHDFLVALATFFKRKYSENWEAALSWANMHILIPIGDVNKLNDIIRTTKAKDYEYRCKTEPICSHCNPYACRKMTYGVGGGGGNNHRELGITIVDRIPRVFYVNVGTARVRMTAKDLVNPGPYRERCVEHGVDFPNHMKREEWDNIIRTALEQATIVPPIDILKTDAFEISLLARFFGMHIPNSVRMLGDVALAGGGDKGDHVRVKAKVERIFFKWDRFENFVMRSLGLRQKEIENVKFFISEKGEYHKDKGVRDWFRYTYSVPFSMFEKEMIQVWMSGGELPEEWSGNGELWSGEE